MIEIDVNAILTCPECETKQAVVMPIDYQQHFYKCANQDCEADIASKKNECCVFCVYSDKLCPMKQKNPDGNQDKKLQSLI